LEVPPKKKEKKGDRGEEKRKQNASNKTLRAKNSTNQRGGLKTGKIKKKRRDGKKERPGIRKNHKEGIRGGKHPLGGQHSIGWEGDEKKKGGWEVTSARGGGHHVTVRKGEGKDWGAGGPKKKSPSEGPNRNEREKKTREEISQWIILLCTKVKT